MTHFKLRLRVRRAHFSVLMLACVAPFARAAEGASPDATAKDPEPRELEVVVRGRPRQEAREDRASAASVITSNRTPRGGESLPQLLAEQPGVAVTSLGGMGSLSLVSLRGSTWEQVRVFVDGVPLNAAVGGGVDLSTVPMGDIDRIEIYRGSSPIAFGASAIGGIVSIATRAPSHNAVTGNLGAGSFGMKTGGVSSSYASNLLKVYAGAHWLQSTGNFSYPSDNGTAFDPSDDKLVPRQNNELDQLDGTLRLTLPLNNAREVALLTSLFTREQGLPGYGLYPTRDASLGTLRMMSSLNYQSSTDLGIRSRVHGVGYFVFAQTRFRDPLSEVSFGAANTRDRTRTAGTTWTARKAWAWLDVGMVVDIRYEAFRPADTEQDPPLGPPASRATLATGVEATASIARLRLAVTPSIRVEGARNVVAGRTLFQDFVPASAPSYQTQPIARVSLVQRPAGWLTLKSNAGRYTRFANFNELYGNSGFVLGNPNLLPEKGWNADVGAVFAATFGRSRLSSEAFAFANLVDQLIQYEQGAYGTQRANNIGKARILGVEASVRAEIGKYVRFQCQATGTDARDTTNVAAAVDRQLPLRPKLRGYVRPELRALPMFGNWTWGVYGDMDATSGNYLDPANLVRMPSRILLGAGINAATPKGRLRFVVSALNLADSRINDFAGYPLPGRTVFASLHLFSSEQGNGFLPSGNSSN